MTREAAVRFLAHLGFNEIDACHIMRIMERESMNAAEARAIAKPYEDHIAEVVDSAPPLPEAAADLWRRAVADVAQRQSTTLPRS